MKNLINSKLFSGAVFVLTMLVITKSIWIAISLLFLPKSGIEQPASVKLEPLYYPVKLAKQSQKKASAPIKIEPKKPIGNMQGYTLLALYHAKEMLVVTVQKGKKTKVLSKGEAIDGFRLTSAGSNYAIFTKGDKNFKLLLKGIKNKITYASPQKSTPIKQSRSINKDNANGITESDNGVSKIVSKKLLSSYTKDIDKIWKDIGIGDYKVNGKLQGFKVNFIKRGSDFEKLGLKKGDILTSINGQELNSYNAAFGFFKEIDSIENLTLNIKRNNQEMELEYEIQ
jgi:general secretion pathway protein C